MSPQAGPQTDFMNMMDDVPLVFYGGAAGGGKALSLETKVLTPHGWSTVGELTIGDSVIDEKGNRQQIIAEYFQPKQTLYDVEFNDGAKITCCPNHLWNVSCSGNISVKNTQQIKEWMEKTGRTPTIPLYNPDISEELFVGNNNLPIDPYLFGFLLGDGYFGPRATFVSTGDEDIITYIHSLGYETTRSKSNTFDYRIRGKDINKKIKALGLLGKKSYSKFVPDIYLNSDYASRKALLQGLLDSDGYRKKERYAAELCVTSPFLAESVQYLVRSLGGTAKMSTKETSFTYKGKKKKGLLAYRLYIRLRNLDDFFLLSRKKGTIPKVPKVRNAIVSIQEGMEDFSKCFTVTGENSLFVIENFIVTHNSHALLMDSLKYIDCPHFYGVYFRKTVKQLERTLWPEAKDMYYPFLIETSGPRKGKFKGKAQIREKDKVIIFPTGAKLEFSYLDSDKDCKENWQG